MIEYFRLLGKTDDKKLKLWWIERKEVRGHPFLDFLYLTYQNMMYHIQWYFDIFSYSIAKISNTVWAVSCKFIQEELSKWLIIIVKSVKQSVFGLVQTVPFWFQPSPWVTDSLVPGVVSSTRVFKLRCIDNCIEACRPSGCASVLLNLCLYWSNFYILVWFLTNWLTL